MKKIFLLITIALLLTSCAEEKEIDGIVYRPYGILNKDDVKNDSILYDVSFKAVTSGIVFCEFFLVPTIYTFGYNLYEPIGKKSDFVKGQAAEGKIVKARKK